MRLVLHNCRQKFATPILRILRSTSLILAFASAGAVGADRPAAAEATAPTSRDPALHTYAAHAAALRAKALQTGRLNYREVMEAAYAPGVIDPSVLAAKARWRATVGGGFDFVTDYSVTTAPASVEPLVATPDPRLHSTLVAQYEATANVVGISTAATDFAVFHEAGHSLQRGLLLQGSGGAGSRRPHNPEDPLARPLRAGIADATSVQRLIYLCSQDEFEVRLQDLNRFHALLVGGRPIMDADDSLRALVALGMPLSYEEARQAFASAGRDLSRAAFERDSAVTPVPAADTAAAFEDACELLLARRLALRVDEAYWQRLLAKIIFEAPGHF